MTYGLHSDGNGRTNWYTALTNGNGYYAGKEAIYSDPCPESKTNEGTAGQTSGSNNNNYNDTYNSSGNDNNTTANNYQNNNTNNSQPVQKKSNDTSIEYIIINNKKNKYSR